MSLVAAVIWSRPERRSSIYDLAYLVGPAVRSLHDGQGLAAPETDRAFATGHVIFRAARMPLTEWVLAGTISLTGDHYLIVDVIKTLVLLIPILVCIFLCTRAARSVEGFRKRAAVYLLLVLPFFIPLWLGNTIRMQQEEGYSYSFLALLIAILYFSSHVEDAKLYWTGVFCVCLACLYLAKSSMLLAVCFLALCQLFKMPTKTSRIMVLLTVVLVPMGWGAYTKHASGRFTLGTSLDGLNLYKGNNDKFLERYPPAEEGQSLDPYDKELTPAFFCKDEWDCDSYHQRAAIAYVRHHPWETVVGAWRKFDVFALSLKTYGSEVPGKRARIVFRLGLFVARVLLWSGIITSILLCFSTTGQMRWMSVIFLGTTLAIMTPYIVGFALTRHFSILLYPAALLLAGAVIESDRKGKGFGLPVSMAAKGSQ
jgi:hypothetical protein